MRILIVNDAADDVRVYNNMLAGLFVRPALPARETEIPMRILIVDDIPDNIRVLSSMLAGEGIEISTATSGRRALKIAERYPPDLVLLDIMMPEMDGYEVIQAMKADTLLRGIPVIFISALSDEDSEVRGLELGAVDYITKPFKEAIVKLRIKTHLELKLQRELLNNLSRLDGLTGIPNRRAFDEQLGLEWRRASRTGDRLGLLMVDVDLFKGYNDHNGHLAGDDCLRKIADALHESLNRAGDFVARFDGEEFAALLPSTSPQELAQVAERMRAAVAALRIPHGASDVSPWVSVSVGGASVAAGRETEANSLIERAGQQLHRAKAAGRDRVCAAAS
ncbi:MAG: diguanylate cyclase domain-containing protein [Candidatus Methylumidiphilus sp.]